MKKTLILLALLSVTVHAQMASKNEIPATFHGKWVAAGESCDEYENGETIRWWSIHQHKISQYRSGCTLDKVITATPQQLRAKWRCEDVDDDGEIIQSAPTDTFTSNGKQLTAFKQKYRFCGKHQSKDVFVCHSDKINIAVSSYDYDYRYTAWTKSRTKPDLFLQNGNVRIDGTGRYLHSVYTFTRPDGWQYEVREGAYHTAEPDDIKGWVTVTRHGKTISEIVCK